MFPAVIDSLRRGKLEVSNGFLLLMAWLNYADTEGLLAMTVLACIAHELGHYCMIALLGGTIESVRLTVAGAEIRLGSEMSYLREIACASAGPFLNLVLSMLCGRLRGEWWLIFAGINLSLAIFNLLPIGGLDGGRIMRCVFAQLFGVNGAGKIGSLFDRVLTVAVLAIGIWVYSRVAKS